MKQFFTTLSILLLVIYANAQDRSKNVWCFGDSVQLDFNSGAPVSVSGSVMATNEGCISIADKNTGQLLFYSDGSYVWDASNNIMPSNSSPLGGNSSATESALIIPMPGSGTLYYLFTVDASAGYYGGGNGGVSYSIIDMSLNGGLGDISQQPQTLVTPTCEKITATRMANNSGYWIITHLWGNNKFSAYPVTASGIGTPVNSSIGLVVQGGTGRSAAIGYMKVSPDGSKIALAHYNNYTLQAFNFNNATGVVSGNLLSDNTLSVYNFNVFDYTGPYGVSFSPNSKLLYTTVDGDANIYQYNLAAGNPAAVLASRNVVGVSSAPYALQLGPDQKLYIDEYFYYNSSIALDRIDLPNIYGSGCNFHQNVVPINYGRPIFGLPFFIDDLSRPVRDTLAYSNCSGDTMIAFLDTTLGGTPAYLWNFGDAASGVLDTSTIASPTHHFSTSGVYQVTLKINTGTDSFTVSKSVNVHNSHPVVQISANANICANDSTQLLASIPNAKQYTWSPQAGLSCVSCANPFAHPGNTTEYYVQATDSFGCTGNDSVKVSVGSANLITITSNRDTICSGDSAHICAPAGQVAYQWNLNADTSTCIYAALAGNYYVTVTEQGGCTVQSNHLALNVYSSLQVQISVNGDTLTTHNGLSYQWLLNGNPIPDAINSVYVALENGTYAVEVGEANGCQEISPITQITTTGIETFNNSEWVKIYPNPSTSGNWQLATSQNLIGGTVEIYDDNARLVYKSEIRNQLSNIFIDVAHGVYTMRVTSGNTGYNLKLIKL